jgi:hypothetical protein
MVFPVVGGNQSSGDLITNSLRFNDGDSPSLQFTPSSDSNEQTWTVSFWVKRGVIGTSSSQMLFMSDTNLSEYIWVRFCGTEVSGKADMFQVFMVEPNGREGDVRTNRLFRDVSAWYHIVVRCDLTQSTAANRLRIYVNGVKETSFDTASYLNQNDDNINWNSNVKHAIGHQVSNTTTERYFDGYLANFYNIDGSSLGADSFGETNDNGVWVPKQYTGSFGTNGYFLEFQQTGTSANSSGMGADTSGNDHHWTPANLAATDVTTDTPQNNFCTINSVFADDGTNTVAADYSEGNTKLLKTVDGWGHGRGTFLLSSGKWYVEAKVTETGTGQIGQFGIVPSVLTGTTDANDKIEGLRVNMGGSDTIFQKMDTGTGSNVFTDFASGDIVMLAIDLDNNKLWVGNDGTWYNNNNASTTFDASNEDVTLPSNDEGWIFTIGGYRDSGNNLAWEFNWGNPSFSISSSNSDANGYGNMEFAVPTGFYTCCTKNLAEYG